MRYRFSKLSTGEKLRAAASGLPVTIVESGTELVLDFGERALTAEQETALADFLAKRELEFTEKGENLEATDWQNS